MKMKNKKFARILSWLLVFTMILSLQPFSAMPVKAEGESSGMNVTLYFDNSETKWEEPAFYFWNAGEGTQFTNTGDPVNIWGSDVYKLSVDSGNWYKITVQGTLGGFLFVDNKNQDDDHKIQNPGPVLEECADGTINDVYMIGGEWYKDREGKTLLQEPKAEPELGKHVITLAGESGLAGSGWNPEDTNNDFVYDADSSTYKKSYKGVAPGKYQYKIVKNHNWDDGAYGPNNDNQILELTAPADVTFTIDTTKPTEIGVEITYVQFIDVKTAPLKKGESLTLEATYYEGDGKTSATDGITFATKEAVAGVTVDGNKVITEKTVAGTELAMVATYGTFKQDFTIQLLDKTYKVTFNVFSQDYDLQPGKSDVYIWKAGTDVNTSVKLDGSYVDEENGITWVTGTIELPYNNIGLKGRPVAGSWDAQDGADRTFNIPENQEEITLWYVYGSNPVTEKPVVTISDPRYVVFEYENTNINFIPKFYSWSVGNSMFAEPVPMTDNGNGKYSITFKASSTCNKVDYVLVYDNSGSDWIKDGGDHSIEFPLDQNVLFVKMSEGGEPTLAAPLNIGSEVKPEEEKIYFYYRNDTAVLDGTLADMKPVVVVGGKEYAMEYNAADKRFVASVEAVPGKTYYYYKVNGENILDKYNPNKETVDGVEQSYIEYFKLDVNVTAEVMKKEFNYNENNVVKISVAQNATDKDPALEISKAYIDLSSLGGGKEVPVDTELMAVTISAKYDTALGDKQLPVVVMDQFNNKYKTTVDVKIVERTKNEKDFDWDEAVIYFMLTDRFFDGNTANNTANGANTYGKDNGGLYHGGDFAGLTAKLDYLKDLGVNTIWISPIVENIPGVEVTGDGSADVPYNAAYHGYWASNFTKLNPAMGTEEEFKTLITEAHNRGMKIMVDVVLNHAGYGAEANFEGKLRDKADVSEENFIKGGGQSNLPDFLTEDPSVRAQIVKWQTDWMTNFDIDYYRVDTVKHVESTTWAAFKNELTKADSTFKMIGEYYGAGASANGGTLGTGQMDSTLDFDFNDWASSFINGNIATVEENLVKRNQIINNTYMTGHFLSSHDEEGFKQSLLNSGKPELEAAGLAMMAATLQITAKGQPVIYYGEELGQTGKNNYPYQTNRYDLDWTKATADNATYTHYKKLLSIRNAYTDVFARGDRTVVDANDAKGYDIVKRTYGDESVWVAMNIKNRVQNVTISGLEKNASYVDLYSDTVYTADADGKVQLTIPKISFGGTIILAKQAQETEETVPVKKIYLNQSLTIKKGDSLQLTATVVPADTTEKLTWKSSDTKKVTVSDTGKIKAVAEGSATITVTSESGKKATCKVTVKKKAIKATKVTIKKTSKTMKVGEVKQLKLTVKPSRTTDKITFKSSKKKVISVAKNGVMTAKKPGKATITATVGKKKASITITVKQPATGIKLNKTSATLKKGKTLKLKATITPGNSTDKVTFKSSKKSVATVNSKGVVTAKKKGKATITAKTTSGKTAKCKITVK